MYSSYHKKGGVTALTAGSSDMINFEDALADNRWRLAMTDEMSAHERNKTWELVPVPTGEKVL